MEMRLGLKEKARLRGREEDVRSTESCLSGSGAGCQQCQTSRDDEAWDSGRLPTGRPVRPW